MLSSSFLTHDFFFNLRSNKDDKKKCVFDMCVCVCVYIWKNQNWNNLIENWTEQKNELCSHSWGLDYNNVLKLASGI